MTDVKVCHVAWTNSRADSWDGAGYIGQMADEMRRTDWNRYYQKPFVATRVTRRLTASRLLGYLMAHPPHPLPSAGLVLAEFGGANSCFFDAVQEALHPRQYLVVDSNRLGIQRMQERLGPRQDVVYHCEDVLDLRLEAKVDLVFSVGLVEHFDESDTRRVVEAHLGVLRPGGICVLAFPTPTWLYRATRGVVELAGQWEFPDERPLQRDEVATTLERESELLDGSIVWPILLTQQFLVARKR